MLLCVLGCFWSLGTRRLLGTVMYGVTLVISTGHSVPLQVVLLEASDRFGGWIRTTKLENGALLEHGPHTIRGRGEKAYALLDLVRNIHTHTPPPPPSTRTLLIDTYTHSVTHHHHHRHHHQQEPS